LVLKNSSSSDDEQDFFILIGVLVRSSFICMFVLKSLIFGDKRVLDDDLNKLGKENILFLTRASACIFSSSIDF